ncbi:MAG: response regulator [Veillonellales bacterium]
MKILLIEDSKFSQKVAAKMLSQVFPDAELILADNGVTGYERFQQIRPDVIVTDLLMPRMSGQELIKKIRQSDSYVLIFALTADVQQSTQEGLVQYHIAAFINKPLNQEKLALVQAIVEKRFHDA